MFRLNDLDIHIYQSTFEHETRILKITESLSKHQVFSQVGIIARGSKNLPKSQEIDSGRWVRRLETWAPSHSRSVILKSFHMAEWMCRVMLLLLYLRPKCVNCHSLMVLPLGVIVRMLLGTRLVYDTHELETETANLHGRRKVLYQIAERQLIRYVDYLVTVGDMISSWYETSYPGCKAVTVRNLPRANTRPKQPINHLKNSLGIPCDDLVYLYQGVLGEGRGIETMLRAFRDIPSNRHMVFLGYGELQLEIEEACRNSANIHFHPAVPPNELAAMTCGADIGICLIEPICLSYELSLPNKLFEYLQCGLPVIGADLPEIRSIIHSYQCGWTTPCESAALRDLLNAITVEDLLRLKPGIGNAANNLVWEREEQKLLSIYERRAA